MKRASLLTALLVLLCLAVGASSVWAAPVPGVYDSRSPGSTVGTDFWEDAPPILQFDAWGLSGANTQWYIEGHFENPDGSLTWGFIDLYDSGPWFGGEAGAVGYHGDISQMVVAQSWVGNTLTLTATGSASLNKYLASPWTPGDPMAPVGVLFELGFTGIPELGSAETFSEGVVFGTPDYMKITVVPEPGSIVAALALLGPAGMMFRRRRG